MNPSTRNMLKAKSMHIIIKLLNTYYKKKPELLNTYDKEKTNQATKEKRQRSKDKNNSHWKQRK